MFVLVVGLALLISALLTQWLGDRGLMLAAGVAGFADAHAAAISVGIARRERHARSAEFAALAVLVGFTTNTVSKTVVAFSLGDRRYRARAAAGPGADGAGCLGCVVGSSRSLLGPSTTHDDRTVRTAECPLSAQARLHHRRRQRAGPGAGRALAPTAGRSACSIATRAPDARRSGARPSRRDACSPIPATSRNADELTVAVNSFAATHDGLDVMINNAGVAGSRHADGSVAGGLALDHRHQLHGRRARLRARRSRTCNATAPAC